jgi:hypothetical protein
MARLRGVNAGRFGTPHGWPHPGSSGGCPRVRPRRWGLRLYLPTPTRGRVHPDPGGIRERGGSLAWQVVVGCLPCREPGAGCRRAGRGKRACSLLRCFPLRAPVAQCYAGARCFTVRRRLVVGRHAGAHRLLAPLVLPVCHCQTTARSGRGMCVCQGRAHRSWIRGRFVRLPAGRLPCLARMGRTSMGEGTRRLATGPLPPLCRPSRPWHSTGTLVRTCMLQLQVQGCPRTTVNG